LKISPTKKREGKYKKVPRRAMEETTGTKKRGWVRGFDLEGVEK